MNNWPNKTQIDHPIKIKNLSMHNGVLTGPVKRVPGMLLGLEMEEHLLCTDARTLLAVTFPFNVLGLFYNKKYFLEV